MICKEVKKYTDAVKAITLKKKIAYIQNIVGTM
ncbi:hypothetical protein CLLU_01050 [Clostridium luticellarii]|uniref:Uncharacterized protein n=1 Tax=Clostridium luticellarii TaxID=1691940 RepID=A0A2T0BSS9_9CLOT|nr:hypothetical protein CLLU_01050 [Clostridium luticellarii]